MICPHCDAELPARARSCKECGSDAATGWADHAAHSGLLPPDAVDPRRGPTSGSRVLTAILVLVGFVLCFVVGGILLLAVGAAVALAAAAWMLVRRSPAMRTRERERELARRARGDAGLPQRLIESELSRRPGISRLQAIELALAHLERDRR